MSYILTGNSDYRVDITSILSHINKNNYCIKSGDTVTKSKGAKTNLLPQVLTDLMDNFESATKVVKGEFARLIDTKGIISEINISDVCQIEEPVPAEMADDLINQFNEVKKIFVDPSTFAYFKITLAGNKVPISTEQYRTELTAYIHDYNRRCKLFYTHDSEGKKIYPHRDFQFNAINQLLPRVEAKNYEFEAGARKLLRSKLKFDGTTPEKATEIIKEYLVAMRVPENVDKFKTLGLNNSYQDIVSYVLLHWMWLVKRNLHDTPKTTEEIFLNIYGGQGSGKTTFVECLSRALEYFYAESDIAKVMDTRESKLFVNKRIVFFDEFGSKARLSHDETTAMKKLITTDTINQRIMHSTNHSIEKRKFTGVSATNITIGDVVKDESGSRRYFEIITDTDYNSNTHFDFEFMDSKKVKVGDDKEAFVDIWNIVDDNMDNGYISYNDSIREDIRRIQSTYVPKSSTLQFLTGDMYTFVNSNNFSTEKEVKDYLNGDIEGYDNFSISELYKKYVEWCKINNLEHAKARETFKRELEELPILTKKRRRGRNDDGSAKTQLYWYMFINNDYVEDEVDDE